MYFNELQYLQYPQFGEDVEKFIITSNIFKRVMFRSDLIDDYSNFYDYTLLESDTLDLVANRIYGNPYYYWVILLINEKFNPRFDLPLSDDAFFNFIVDKYGTSEDSQNISDEYTASYTSVANICTVNTTTNHNLKSGRKVFLEFSVGNSLNGRYIITVVDLDTFTVDLGEVISPSTGSVKVSPPYVLYFIKNHKTDEEFYDTDKETYDAEIVANLKSKKASYDDEFIINHNKKIIKLLQPELLQSFLTEFEEELNL